ncbi:disintegrin and metalloproteinase domain-containing protein 10-like [Brevipalpus obovatus]|uniref:disintegrin and metalloproteinase domain-containing protein 10-like n=1 Tax=Brevipalpus obovatus TaxID=246614 RepID=UPI003D9E243A
MWINFRSKGHSSCSPLNLFTQHIIECWLPLVTVYILVAVTRVSGNISDPSSRSSLSSKNGDDDSNGSSSATVVGSSSQLSKSKVPLNRYIHDFDTIKYDAIRVKHRVRRHIIESKTVPQSIVEPIIINFRAKGKFFKLNLKPDARSAFSDSLIVEDHDGKPITDLNFAHIVSGTLTDEPGLSKVYGSIHDGIFEGKIHTPQQTYFVERAHKYRHDLHRNGHNTSSHSIIYSADDVHHDHGHTIGGGCGNDHIAKWMDEISNSAVPGSEREYLSSNKETVSKSSEISADDDLTGYHNKYVKKFNSFNSDKQNKHAGRVKRNAYDDFYNTRNSHLDQRSSHSPRIAPPGHVNQATRYHSPPYSSPGIPHDKSPRVCTLYIQTDTYLWDHIRKDVTSDLKAREEIASLVAQHIKAVNHIYESANFNGIYGLKFIVQRLKINDSLACDNSKKEHNPFCSPNIDVSNFLNLNSQFNHNDFCLAYIFTYRDFSGGTLGLAWVASTSGASGGICEKYKSYTENIQGRQVQTKRSLNTGIITFVNYNSRVPPKVSELTLAHEIGHNFGSPHDFPPSCRPGGSLGNYIMYSSATSGERANNNKFSPCSVRNISAVLDAVFNQQGKDNCFQVDNGPFCGNKIVEEGEECDCGYDAKECTEKCCYPRLLDGLPPGAQACKRRTNARCSPSEGPCCNDFCEFENSEKLCRHDSECTMRSHCSGNSPLCPIPAAKPNKTECNGGTQVCLRGSCSGSICQKYDMEECFLTFKSGAKPDEMCEVACQRDRDPKSCRRTSELEQMRNISGLKLRPGSPCNDFQGYCDVFQRCRAVDAEGPLAKLKNLLWNHRTLLTIKQWATTYWWACMLMAVAAMLFMAVFIKCCAVHTPSSNPKKRPALKLTDTLRHPADTLRRKRTRSAHSRGANHHSSVAGHGSSIPLQPSAPIFAEVGLAQASHQYNITPATSGFASMQHTQLVVALPPETSTNYSSEPPPPYPGLNLAPTQQNRNPQLAQPPIPSASSIVPAHGYGEGRGHYNRKGQTAISSAKNQIPLSKSHHVNSSRSRR